MTLERLSVGPVTHLRLSGVIDETFVPATVAKELTDESIIDLGGLQRISSFGVRQWMTFVKELPQGSTGLYIINAPPIVVDQLSMVEGFSGVAKILSVLAPYSCETCGEDRLRLVDLRADAETINKGEAPAHTCAVCANPLVFADVVDQFFSYPKTNPVGEVSPVVDHYLRVLRTPEIGEISTHVKVVEGNITFVRVGGPLRKDINPRRLGAGMEGTVAYDFGTLSGIEEGGATKLHQVLTMAAESAQVVLWRVPPMLLDVLSNKGLPDRVTVGTVQVAAVCVQCSQTNPTRMSVPDFLAEIAGGGAKRKCVVCGGELRLPVPAQVALALLEEHALLPVALDDIEALEPRALSQYLSTSAGGAKKKAPGVATSGGDKLEVLKRIGRGGMAEVFLARQVGLKGFEKYVVLKKVLPQFAARPDFVEMLFAEARSSARLTHPNVVQIYDVGMLDSSAYITMEYVRGADLRRLMIELRRKKIDLPVEHAVRIISDTASGLHYAHAYVDPTGKPHPVVHRDVSPHNILISFDGAIKLSDFGIAKAEGTSEHTEPGMIKGKIAYLPPETVQGRPADARGDVFSLGVTLYELLTYSMPFRRENDMATLQAIVREQPPNPQQYNPNISKELVDVVFKALEKDPKNRFQTAGELRFALEDVLGRSGMQSTPSVVSGFFESHLDHVAAEFGGPQGGSSPSHPALSSAAAGSSPALKPPAPPDAMAPPVGEDSGVLPVIELVENDSTAFTPTPSATEKPGPPVPADADSVARMRTPAPAQPQSRPAPAAPARPAPVHPVAVSLNPDAVTGTATAARIAPAVRPDGERAVSAVPPARPASPPQPAARPVPANAPAATTPAPAARPVSATPPVTTTPAPAVRDLAARAASPAAPAAVAPSPPAATAVASIPLPVADPGHQAPLLPPPAAASSPAAAVGVLAPEAKRSPTKWIAISVAAVVFIAVGAAIAVTRGGNSSIKVVNASPDERIYVDGARLDGSEFRALAGRSPMVGVARQGLLSRFGAVEGSQLDVAELPEIRMAADERASLTVSSDPKGCSVIIGGEHQTATTPFGTSVTAGRETLVEVMCPGLPRWTRWVMAGPGQAVQLNARMFDAEANL